jgi:hypothetical protein
LEAMQDRLDRTPEASRLRRQTVEHPFGTLKAIELMVAKLGTHPMFQGAGADRLRMCGDCRVIDIHTNPNEVRITDV